MTAFWSNTDEADDRNKTYYTGVIGKLNTANYEYVLRFNYNDVKHKCGLEELFSIEQDETQIPDSWLEKIETQTFNYGKSNKSRQFDPDDESNYHGFSFGYGGDDTEKYLKDNKSGKDNASAGNIMSLVEAIEERQRELQQKQQRQETSEMRELSEEEVLKLMARTRETLSKEEEEVPRYIKNSNSLNHSDPAYLDYLNAQYGEEVANGYDQVAAGITDLDGCDEVLLDIIREAYSMLTVPGQMELSQKGM